jgi:hypothetical protein
MNTITMYVVKVVKNLHLYLKLITEIEITNVLDVFTCTSHICGYFIPQLFGNVSCCSAVWPLCPIKVSFQKLMILISPNQPFSAENTIRIRQNVHRTNSTDEYGRKKLLISGGGR